MKKVLAFIVLIFGIIMCKENFSVIDTFENNKYNLQTSNGEEVVFPECVKGRIVVMNFIFTNCPDICPLSTNNMRMIQEKLKQKNIRGVEFVSLSFDPDFDTPLILRKFAAIRNLDLNNWTFLTGDKKVVSELIKQAGVIAAVGDSTVFSDGSKVYYYVHTDRISLIDTEGRIRKNYIGSSANINEIVDDIKKLGE